MVSWGLGNWEIGTRRETGGGMPKERAHVNSQAENMEVGLAQYFLNYLRSCNLAITSGRTTAR